MSAALRRKLHAAELEHLRGHVEDLRAQVEVLTIERDALASSLVWAEFCADGWRDDALRLINETGSSPGLTQDGRLVAIPPEQKGSPDVYS